MLKKLLALCVVALLAVTVGGCGSNLDSGGSSTSTDTTLAEAQPLGINNCLTCHLTGIAQTWLGGVHGNPAVSEPNSGLVDPACLTCHDQLGDGQKLFTATNGPQANRPVVSCESCHGGGQYHNGIAAGIPFAAPDSNRCGQCHNATFPHGSSPEGKGIVEAFQISPHSRALNANVFVAGTTNVRARCAKCHSDEGAKKYLNVDGDYAYLSANLPNTLATLSDASNIGCRTCHSPHQEEQLLEAASTGRSAEFNTCTNCHQLLQASSSAKIIAYHDPAANQYGAVNEIITDTHFATPGNFVNGTNNANIAGYAFDFSSNRACRDCHNPHSAATTINKQWVASGHADTTAAGAWAHYNWTEIPGAVRNDFTVVSAFGDRRPCQRCHTTTGVIAYLIANTDANPSDYVAPMAYNSNFKPEMLKCNGCHTDNVGNLRTTGQITAAYTNAPHQYPDAGDSNLCLACHTGVESGESIKSNTDADGVLSFINSHYLTAGGTIYAASGYEYPGKSYANLSYYAHDQIGSGDQGPCIGCHLSAPEKHSFQPVTKDAAGAITAITSTVCVTCHAGQYALTPAALNAEEEDFSAALEALDAQLAAKGIFFSTAYPYFYKGENATGGAFTNWAGVYGFASYKDTMGAAFNYNLLEHDPGAYAHNRIYAKRLIYDAIDFLDNGAVDGSTLAAIDALVTTESLDSSVANIAKLYLDGDAATAGLQRP